jgi:hypothetical protein
MRRSSLLILPLIAAGCLSIGPAPARGLAVEQQAWWSRLRALCGGSYPGRLLEQGSADDRYRTEPLAARVTGCAADTVEIAFDVGAERTRVWRITRLPGALRLRHLHLDGTGGADSPTDYGGTTVTRGTAGRQDFPADSATARMLPPAARNVWSIEIEPGRSLVYTLGRPGVRQRFRVEFALPRPP